MTEGLAVTTWGEGAETVVALHSGGMSSRQWRALGRVLSDRWRVVAPDLLGSGANPPWDDARPFALSLEVDAVRAVVEPLGPVHLVGHSYGALIAMKLAARDPSLARSLTLYEPPAFGLLDAERDADVADELYALERDPAFTDEATGGGDAWLERFIDWWSGAGAWRSLPDEGRAAFARVGRKVFREVQGIMADRDGVDAYRHVKVPALLLSGALTPRPERRVMEQLARAFPDGERAVIEGAGHMGPITHAGEVNAAVRAWLERVESRA
ncbi:MAG: alpha/beta hydrolase [Polyangiales bacterium]